MSKSTFMHSDFQESGNSTQRWNDELHFKNATILPDVLL